MDAAVARQLNCALGYLELGLHNEAEAELGALAPNTRQNRQVRSLYLQLYQERGDWENMQSEAAALRELSPQEPQWLISLAYATRRATGLAQATALLSSALEQFPNEPIIPYNLACYACVQGDLEKSRKLLERAAALDFNCWELAEKDPDLIPLRAWCRECRTKARL